MDSSTFVGMTAFTLVLMCGVTAGLMCYQCSDTSSDQGRNQCQTYVRTMNHYRRQFLATGSARKYVMRCTEQTACAITSIEHLGGYKSFIRDCTDGKNFFKPEYNVVFRDAIADNQTTCHYVK